MLTLWEAIASLFSTLFQPNPRVKVMSDQEFKEPYNIFYFLGFIAALLIPTLPATLTWIRVMNGYAGF